jgi:anion-transporting  ArsA/GET3 family ATPase
VGKTTVAAALGLSRALAGGKVLVCTIDPARRLANALGLEALGNAETPVPAQAFAEAALAPRGRLFAMMLDVKRTWDDLVARHAPDAERRERIYGNRLYRQLSSALAGSQEFMAMEKLYELATERDYDLVVLDTPPTAHAMEFLDAPERILDFLGNETARAILSPALHAGRLGLRLFQLGGSWVARKLARFTGAEALRDLADFLAAFHGMYEGFERRAAAVRALLSAPGVGFVLVSSAAPAAVDEALVFHQRLREEGKAVAAVVANRVTSSLWSTGPLPDEAALGEALRGRGRADLAARLARTLLEHEAGARGDSREVARLLAAVDAPAAVVPRFDVDLHDLAGLARLAEHL